MAFSPNVWNQLKNLTADRLIAALEKDGWTRDQASKGAILGFIKAANPGRNRITIHYHHYHHKKAYGAGLLKRALSRHRLD